MIIKSTVRFALLVFAVDLAAPIRPVHALASLRSRSGSLWTVLGRAARLLPLLLFVGEATNTFVRVPNTAPPLGLLKMSRKFLVEPATAIVFRLPHWSLIP